MLQQEAQDAAIKAMREIVVRLVRQNNMTLSMRQLAVFMVCYFCNGECTVLYISEALSVSQTVVRRAMDTLDELGLTKRRVDPRDGDVVFVEQTLAGLAFLGDLHATVARSARRESLMMLDS